jgi:AraC family transcriptional regulator of adaptative response / DNA-3-methyladenine glycosylase II
VLGQQVTVKSAATLARRFAEAFGPSIETPDARLVRLFPRAADIAILEYSRIAELGIIASRAQAIVSLAREIAEGRLRLDTSAEVNDTFWALERIAGIGPWTAQYIAMRALSWPDAFPHPDVAVLKALKEKRPRAAMALMERWRPWRAYAVLHLWRKLA